MLEEVGGKLKRGKMRLLAELERWECSSEESCQPKTFAKDHAWKLISIGYQLECFVLDSTSPEKVVPWVPGTQEYQEYPREKEN